MGWSSYRGARHYRTYGAPAFHAARNPRPPLRNDLGLRRWHTEVASTIVSSTDVSTNFFSGHTSFSIILSFRLLDY
jgi:hypothetical protein